MATVSHPIIPARDPARGRHSAKLTVYLTDPELIAVEQAVLDLRRVYGIRTDRSRLIRAALALVELEGIAAHIVEVD